MNATYEYLQAQYVNYRKGILFGPPDQKTQRFFHALTTATLKVRRSVLLHIAGEMVVLPRSEKRRLLIKNLVSLSEIGKEIKDEKVLKLFYGVRMELAGAYAKSEEDEIKLAEKARQVYSEIGMKNHVVRIQASIYELKARAAIQKPKSWSEAEKWATALIDLSKDRGELLASFLNYGLGLKHEVEGERSLFRWNNNKIIRDPSWLSQAAREYLEAATSYRRAKDHDYASKDAEWCDKKYNICRFFQDPGENLNLLDSVLDEDTKKRIDTSAGDRSEFRHAIFGQAWTLSTNIAKAVGNVLAENVYTLLHGLEDELNGQFAPVLNARKTLDFYLGKGTIPSFLLSKGFVDRIPKSITRCFNDIYVYIHPAEEGELKMSEDVNRNAIQLKNQIKTLAPAIRELRLGIMWSQSISKLIHKGENDKVEFKSSLRCGYNRDSIHDDIFGYAAMKTLAAFMNSEGGTLLLGVSDKGEVLGLEKDFSTFTTPDTNKFDKFKLHLTDLIGTYLGQSVGTMVKVQFESIEGKTIAKVQVKPSSSPIYLKRRDKLQEFFVRSSNSSRSLDMEDAHKYIRDHWKTVVS